MVRKHLAPGPWQEAARVRKLPHPCSDTYQQGDFMLCLLALKPAELMMLQGSGKVGVEGALRDGAFQK